MNNSETLPRGEEAQTPGRFVLPSLSLSYFVTWTPALVVGLLLLDIGDSFGQSVGVISQIQTIASLVTAFTAILMGIWSIRFKNKSLLLVGLVCSSLSAVVCVVAFNFSMMVIAYSIMWGFGLAMVEPMLFTIVGEQFPLDQRARAIGWLMTGISLSGIIGVPIIGIIAERAGWRRPFLWFVVPLLLLCITMVALGVTSPDQSQHSSTKSHETYWDGFQEVFKNRSALMCLLGSSLAMAVYQGLGFFGASFLREQFLVSIGFVAIIGTGIGIFGVVGSQVGGRLVNRVGRKPLTVFSASIAGISTIFYTNVNELWLAVTFRSLGFMCLMIMFTAASILTLEQVPKFRGTMMALQSAAWYLGSALGSGIGGLALILFDYRILGLSLGLMGIAIALTYNQAVVDPTAM